jgi:hypothetical protein
MKVAEGIHRIGDDPRVNACLVEEAGEVTIIDAATPGFGPRGPAGWRRRATTRRVRSSP